MDFRILVLSLAEDTIEIMNINKPCIWDVIETLHDDNMVGSYCWWANIQMVTALLIYRNDCFSYRPFNYFSPSAILLNTNTAICCTKVSCLVSCFMSCALMLELLGTGIAEKAHSYASKGPGLCLWGRWISKHTLRGNLGSSTSPAFLERLDNRNFPKNVELSKRQSSGNELGTRIHQNGGGAKRSR